MRSPPKLLCRTSDHKPNSSSALKLEIFFKIYSAYPSKGYAGQHASIVTLYLESFQRMRICLDSYLDFEFTWWHKLFKISQLGNLFRDRLIMEDISILENLYPTFDQKITLKNDTSAQLVTNYLQTWYDRSLAQT